MVNSWNKIPYTSLKEVYNDVINDIIQYLYRMCERLKDRKICTGNRK